MRLRSASLLLLVCLATAPSCGIYYGVGKFVGFIAPPPFETRKEIPEDLRISVDVHDVVSPPTDYILTFERSGVATYSVVVRSPQRRQLSGTFEITEAQIAALWQTVAASKFDKLDKRYPSSGDGTDKKVGAQTFYVFADGAEHRVESHFVANPSLESIRVAVVKCVPQEIMEAAHAPGQAPKAPNEFVGDAATHLFHMPNCPKLKDMAPNDRRKFTDAFLALDQGFSPCPECRPEETTR